MWEKFWQNYETSSLEKFIRKQHWLKELQQNSSWSKLVWIYYSSSKMLILRPKTLPGNSLIIFSLRQGDWTGRSCPPVLVFFWFFKQRCVESPAKNDQATRNSWHLLLYSCTLSVHDYSLVVYNTSWIYYRSCDYYKTYGAGDVFLIQNLFLLKILIDCLGLLSLLMSSHN